MSGLLPPCFRNAQLEADENALRGWAGLPLRWRQPLNTRALNILERAGFTCPVPARVLKLLILNEWLDRMGNHVGRYLRESNQQLQVLHADSLSSPDGWEPLDPSNIGPDQHLCAEGLISEASLGRDSVLREVPLSTEDPLFPPALRNPGEEEAYIGCWSLESAQAPLCTPLTNGGLHHGLLVVFKRPDGTPSAHVAGYLPAPDDGRSAIYPLDPSIAPLSAGRRSASAELFQVSSNELLHQIEGLLRQETFPLSEQSSAEDLSADRLLAPLWKFPLEKRFPAFVHLLIGSTASGSHSLMQACKRVGSRIPGCSSSSLTARSVIELAMELAASTYREFDGKVINCRFLAQRVMRVVNALLNPRRAGELEGRAIACIQIRATPHAILARVLLWIADMLGWFAERFATKQPLPETLRWKAPEMASGTN